MQTLLNPASPNALLIILRLIWRGKFDMAPCPEDRHIDPQTFPSYDPDGRRALIIRAMASWPHAEWSKGIGWAISQDQAAASGGTKRGPGRPKYHGPARVPAVQAAPVPDPVMPPAPVPPAPTIPAATQYDVPHAPAAPQHMPAPALVIPDPPAVAPIIYKTDDVDVMPAAPPPPFVPTPHKGLDMVKALALHGYQVPPEMNHLILVIESCLNTGKQIPNILLSGESGTGKTAFALALAAVMNAPLHAVPLGLGTTQTQLIGQLVLEADGGSAWRDGYIPRAYRIGGVLVLDELGACQDGIAAVLHPALETPRRPFLIAQTGELVQPSHLVIIGTDNGAGVGAASQRNRHTTGLSAALRERFSLQLTVNGPTGPALITALVNHHGVNRDAACIAGKVMDAGASLVTSGAIYSTAFGFRLAVAFSHTLAMLDGPLETHAAALAAADLTLALSITEPERGLLNEALRRVLPPPAPTPEPSNV